VKLGFDVDDTLINLREHAFHLYKRKLKKETPIETFRELKTVAIHKPFGLTDEEGRKMWMENRDEIYFTDCPPFPFAIEVLQELEKDGNEIYYVTSREGKHCQQTKEWLQNAGFPVHDERFYCGMKDPEKVRIINELGIDYYFDDKPAVLETLVNSAVKVYAKSHPYNDHLALPRINSWDELKEILKKDRK
jgi:uncharacterized HAD superfamily protein